MLNKALHHGFSLLSGSTDVIKSIAKSTSRSTAHLAMGTAIAISAVLPNPALARVSSTEPETKVESTLIARSSRRPFQGAPAPAWRRRCEIRPVVVGYRRVRALTNPRTQRVPTQSGWALVRSNGLTTQRIPITRPIRVCRTV